MKLQLDGKVKPGKPVKITLTLDYGDKVPELDEGNNSLTLTTKPIPLWCQTGACCDLKSKSNPNDNEPYPAGKVVGLVDNLGGTCLSEYNKKVSGWTVGTSCTTKYGDKGKRYAMYRFVCTGMVTNGVSSYPKKVPYKSVCCPTSLPASVKPSSPSKPQ